MVFETTDAVGRNVTKINELNFWWLSHLSETYLMYQKFALITREENILIYTNCQCFFNCCDKYQHWQLINRSSLSSLLGFLTNDAVARNMKKINELKFWWLLHLSETYLMSKKFSLITREMDIFIYTNCQCFLTEICVTVTSINIDTCALYFNLWQS
jgi:hypothetical protein